MKNKLPSPLPALESQVPGGEAGAGTLVFVGEMPQLIAHPIAPSSHMCLPKNPE